MAPDALDDGLRRSLAEMIPHAFELAPSTFAGAFDTPLNPRDFVVVAFMSVAAPWLAGPRRAED